LALRFVEGNTNIKRILFTKK